MRFHTKLTLLSLGVSAVPLAIAGYSSTTIGRSAVRRAIEENELMVARQVSSYVGNEVHHMLDTLRVDARIFDLTRAGEKAPSEEALVKFLQFVYHQSDSFTAVAMFDEHGAPLGQPAYMEAPEHYPAFKDHEPMRPTDVEAVGLMAPLGNALSDGVGVGPVFLGGPNHVPHVVLAVAFDPSLGGGRRLLAAEVTLRPLVDYIRAASRPEKDVQLLDQRWHVIASGHLGADARLQASHVPKLVQGEPAPAPFVASYESNGIAVIGAFSASPPSPFAVVVETVERSALLPVNLIGWATLLWIAAGSLAGALVARIFARGLAARVARLATGSRAIAEGDLSTRLSDTSRDELGELAHTFNGMAVALEAAHAEIVEQNDEILGWNRTLEKRVEENTRELRQAQEMLLRSRSLAALGELGSGVAHEINNPLAGVLGLSQLVLADLSPDNPARPMVEDIEAQALRIRKIVFNLLRFAQRQAGEDFQPLEVSRVLDDAIELCGPSELSTLGIQVVRHYLPGLPLIRGSATRLQEAFIQLIQNARNAMGSGGTLTIETTLPDSRLVRVAIGDTGRGIPPENLPRIFDPFFTTKDDWSRTGMGLTLVHKTVEEHGGQVQVQSEPGRGTTFWLTFPAQNAQGALA